MTLRVFSLHRIADSFSYAGFRQLWAGSVITEGTYRMQDVAFAWQILQLTQSPFWVGLTAFVWGSLAGSI